MAATSCLLDVKLQAINGPPSFLAFFNTWKYKQQKLSWDNSLVFLYLHKQPTPACWLISQQPTNRSLLQIDLWICQQVSGKQLWKKNKLVSYTMFLSDFTMPSEMSRVCCCYVFFFLGGGEFQPGFQKFPALSRGGKNQFDISAFKAANCFSHAKRYNLKSEKMSRWVPPGPRFEETMIDILINIINLWNLKIYMCDIYICIYRYVSFSYIYIQIIKYVYININIFTSMMFLYYWFHMSQLWLFKAPSLDRKLLG